MFLQFVYKKQSFNGTFYELSINFNNNNKQIKSFPYKCYFCYYLEIKKTTIIKNKIIKFTKKVNKNNNKSNIFLKNKSCNKYKN